MIRCVVLSNSTDVNVHATVNYIYKYSGFNNPNKFVWNVYKFA